MNKPSPIPDFHHLAEQLRLAAQLRIEQGATGLDPALQRAERALKQSIRALTRLQPDARLTAAEPDGYAAIAALRPAGVRRMWNGLEPAVYRTKLAGALLARMAGCTLGAPVELWSIERMEEQASENGDPFPPTDYWTYVPEPQRLRYGMSRHAEYFRGTMRGVPVDDDIVYTLLGLLVLEQYGPDFTVEQVGEAWLRYLPHACTAEDVALRNLRAGMPASRVADQGNPFCEWIGAAIRADAWGYVAAGWPERAAHMAWRDAMLSHRRNGIYGEMFWAAAIAAAFTVEEPLQAIALGLAEIPRNCRLARAVRWALKVAPRIHTYREARTAVDAKFPGMHPVHTINNACLTVFGLAIGGTDVTRVIAETVAMGHDNDCTAATAGSIVGAIVGRRGVPRHWYRRFGNTVWSYLNDEREFKLDDLLARFERQAAITHAGDWTAAPRAARREAKANQA